MDPSLLVSRRAQHGLAGPSSRCAASLPVRSFRGAPSSAVRRIAAAPRTVAAPRQPVACSSNGKTLTPSPLWDEVSEDDGFRDNAFRLTSPASASPDYDDPDWMSKVDDWYEFWNYQSWELEVEDLATEEGDMAGPAEALRRAEQLVDAFEEMDRRTDIINWMGTPHSEDAFEEDKWTNPPVAPVKRDPNPTLSPTDLRARAEKRRQLELMDAEWRRRQALIGTREAMYAHRDDQRDIRVSSNLANGYRQDWTDEEIYQLIINNGLACRPETHGGLVENPLVPADYHALGVEYIEETEELLLRTGHMASADSRTQYDREFILHGEDYGEDEKQQQWGAEDGLEEEEEDDGSIEYAGNLDEDEGRVREMLAVMWLPTVFRHQAQSAGIVHSSMRPASPKTKELATRIMMAPNITRASRAIVVGSGALSVIDVLKFLGVPDIVAVDLTTEYLDVVTTAHGAASSLGNEPGVRVWKGDFCELPPHMGPADVIVFTDEPFGTEQSPRDALVKASLLTLPGGCVIINSDMDSRRWQ
ncbi:hypothetical protein TSOC_004524, partial [Tetrabaena socialis]